MKERQMKFEKFGTSILNKRDLENYNKPLRLRYKNKLKQKKKQYDNKQKVIITY